jgi:hypothetical protein
MGPAAQPDQPIGHGKSLQLAQYNSAYQYGRANSPISILCGGIMANNSSR